MSGMTERISTKCRRSNDQNSQEALEAYCACFPKVGKAVQTRSEEGMELGKLLDSITINMPLAVADKQKILSAISVRERFTILTGLLTREVEVIRIKSDLARISDSGLTRTSGTIFYGNSYNTLRKSWGKITPTLMQRSFWLK